MACPKCKCKVCYQYDDDDYQAEDNRLERCAMCGHIFDAELEGLDDDDYLPGMWDKSDLSGGMADTSDI